ncbi:hypothetical protein N0V82_006650 [Gnomoniopsis sp. IMI 355080]|nr:hypothetical protein N0V82_006650 [Gnomoniopsis sp. IMI 355080]
MTSQTPNPLQLQVPVYPNRVDQDLPTSRELPFDFTEYQDLAILLQIPRFNSDDGWIKDTTRADDNFRPFVHSPPNSCYRNAALVALMNLPPFMNFLRKVSNTPHDDNAILLPLTKLAVALRDPSPEQNLNRYETLKNLMEVFWNHLRRPAVPSDPGIHPMDGWGAGGASSDMDDPSQFIFYLFDRIASYDLSQYQVDPASGISMIDMFKRLFRTDLIARTPFRCQCGNLKRRLRVFRKGYVMEMNLQTPRRLEELISESFWDEIRTKETPSCLVCGALASAKAEYYKFAYLPEVLIFSTSYVRDNGTGVPGSAWTNNPAARLMYPETLDMSNLRDDPDGRDADRNCLYRLQSIVVSPNQATPMWVSGGAFKGVHFKAYVRRDDTAWTLLDDLTQSASQVDINEIRRDTFRPRLLMYVRVHPPEKELQDPGRKDKNTGLDDRRAGKYFPPETGRPNFSGVDMRHFTKNKVSADEPSEIEPAKAKAAPTVVELPESERNRTTTPANPTSNEAQTEVKPQAGKRQRQPPKMTGILPADEALFGPLECDQNLKTEGEVRSRAKEVSWRGATLGQDAACYTASDVHDHRRAAIQIKMGFLHVGSRRTK